MSAPKAEAAGLTVERRERCLYITAANTQCLLFGNHSGAHDVIGDQYSQPQANDPEWGRKRAWAWYRVEQSRLAGLLVKFCRCGHNRGTHTEGPQRPGGPCVACSCARFDATSEGA